MRCVEQIFARGHANIMAKHPTTIEITKSSSLSEKGDCIVAVMATKGLSDLSENFKRCCRVDNARILAEICSSGIVERICGRGCHLLPLNHPDEIVFRKSNFVSNRTLMIGADAASIDLNRKLIKAIRSSSATISIKLTVEI